MRGGIRYVAAAAYNARLSLPWGLCLRAAPKVFDRVLTYLFLWSLPVFISSAYAQTAAAAGGDNQSTLFGLLPLLVMLAVLYFVMIRPQMKKQKEHKAMIDALAKGDEVVSSGGLLGKVTKLGESVVSLEVAGGVEVQIQRGAIVQVLPKGSIK